MKLNMMLMMWEKEVGYLKIKAILILYEFVLLFVIISFFTITVDSEEDQYTIELIDKKFEVIRIKEFYNRNIVYYKIFITLKNSGNIESDDITVKIEDKDGSYIRNSTIFPNESEVFIFDDHPIISMEDQIINISYFPTDIGTALDESNHGDDKLILKPNKNENNLIPGFEIIFLFAAIIVYIFYNKYIK
jgi:hypothetical protein